VVEGCDLIGRYHLVDLGMDGMIILKWILNKWGFEGMDWVLVVQDRVQCLGLINIVINHLIP
jgi:hypothetical protein